MGGLKIVAVLCFALCALAQGACEAKTSAEVIQGYRTALSCADKKPTSCACSEHKEPKMTCDAEDKALWTAKWANASAKCVKVTPNGKDGKHNFNYPWSYGNTCAQTGMEPGTYACTVVAGK